MPAISSPVAVVGGGAAGLTSALALARAGFDIALIAPSAPASSGRTVALFDGSARMLRALGLWQRIEPRAAPLERLTLIDDTGSLFAPPPATFAASEIGLDAFGWNIDLGDLQDALDAAVADEPRISRFHCAATGFESGADGARVTLSDGRVIATPLVIAADGGRSRLREAAGIAVREWSYPQTALTLVVRHSRDHRNISTEFHTREGPFTFVPLPGRRSSIVWVMRPDRAEELRAASDEELSALIEKRSHSFLGAIEAEGPRGFVPLRSVSARALTAPSLMLVGEAAHVFPPIGAQGLNLGLRDAATLADILSDARAAGSPLNHERVRRRYEQARRADVGLRAFSVDLLNRTLLSAFLPNDFLRGAGLLALESIGPLRRFVMRAGVAPPGSTPRLMRAEG